ncbi:MAG: hypothetical protein LBU51_06645 [Bacteroidales bacterium]|nr:hypothetical protein [Bacteroidales bacterium]
MPDFFKIQKEKINRLNSTDPDLIPLHALLAKEIDLELQQFDKETVPLLPKCASLNYYNTVKQLDELTYSLTLKKADLFYLSSHIDSIFIQRAKNELVVGNKDNTFYLLERALLYKRTNVEALLLYTKLLFEDKQYDESLLYLHILYKESEERHLFEQEIGDFNTLFYKTIYNSADSLIKKEKASEALYLFQLLENFCTQLPAEYCNDDYYHGILKSKAGIYDSYLLIAKVARQKGNREIAEKFVGYAEEYRLENGEYFKEEQIAENGGRKTENGGTEERIPEIIKNRSGMVERRTEVQGNGKIEAERLKAEEQKAESRKAEEVKNAGSKTEESKNEEIKKFEEVKKMEIEYKKLALEALELCLKDKFAEAYKLLQKAKEMEKCDCFTKDFRVEMLYDTLKKKF